jgi:hypothetical protein
MSVLIIDTETTGIDPERDQVIELGVQLGLTTPWAHNRRTWRFKPSIPIPEEASAVHGITDADVADCSRFADHADNLRAFIGRRIAQNARAAGCRSYTEATITEVLRDLEEEGVVDGPAHGDELVGVWSVVRDEGPGTASDTASTPSDPVNHPAHYNAGGIEVIDAIDAWGLDSDFALANAVKYIARAGKKGPDKLLEDLRKARWYLDWRIRKLEEEK